MRAAEQIQLASPRHLLIWLVTDASLVTRKLIAYRHFVQRPLPVP
jgi:hypothetical protein